MSQAEMMSPVISAATTPEAFNAVMNAGSDGIEAAMRCYVAGDFAGVGVHLDAVDLAASTLRGWVEKL